MSDREKLIEVMARAIYAQRPHQYWDHSEQTRGWVYADYDEVDAGWRELATQQATAALAALEASGVRLVPVVSDATMDMAGDEVTRNAWRLATQADADTVWTAMLAASPYASKEK